MPESNTAGKTVELSGGPTNNRSQDAYEELRELLRQISVFPSQMRVDWATEGQDAPVVIGSLNVLDVLRINRAIRKGMERARPVNLLEERPYRPLVGETVFDAATDKLGWVSGFLLRPLEAGEQWTAEADDIRPPDRDKLMRTRMAQLDRDRRATPPMPCLEPAKVNRVTP